MRQICLQAAIGLTKRTQAGDPVEFAVGRTSRYAEIRPDPDLRIDASRDPLIATIAGVLDQANLGRARLLVITTPDPYKARAIVSLARGVNPAIDTVVRTHSEPERAYLERLGIGAAVVGERELANAMARSALERCGAVRDADWPSTEPVSAG